MAIFKISNAKTWSHGALRNVLEYVLRYEKETQELCEAIGPYSGLEIDYQTAYKDFLQEKQTWEKDSGRQYEHSILSWHKDDAITPEEALEFTKEFAEKAYPDHQVIIAVHTDKKNGIDSHMVVNSVSYFDGRKLHSTKADLEAKKELCNAMSKERGLHVPVKGVSFEGFINEEKSIWDKDLYRVIEAKGEKSFVIDCATAVLNAISVAESTEQFVLKMQEYGWSVEHLDDKRKYLTFEKDGQKVRDIKLQKTFEIGITKEDVVNGQFERIKEKTRDCQLESIKGAQAAVAADKRRQHSEDERRNRETKLGESEDERGNRAAELRESESNRETERIKRKAREKEQERRRAEEERAAEEAKRAAEEASRRAFLERFSGEERSR